jgi:hypothetical protein
MTVKEHEERLTELANKFGSDKGKRDGEPPSQHLTRHYAKLFHTMRDQPLRLLEIGLNLTRKGECASLKMWLEYFPRAEIYGIDIDQTDFSHERVTIFQGDQGSKAFWEHFLAEVKEPFDIIIDDASHLYVPQQLTLKILFDRLVPKGIYIIEDLRSIMSHEDHPDFDTYFLLRALKERNMEKIINRYPFTFSELSRLITQIESVEFYDSLRFGPDSFGLIMKQPSSSL